MKPKNGSQTDTNQRRVPPFEYCCWAIEVKRLYIKNKKGKVICIKVNILLKLGSSLDFYTSLGYGWPIFMRITSSNQFSNKNIVLIKMLNTAPSILKIAKLCRFSIVYANLVYANKLFQF